MVFLFTVWLLHSRDQPCRVQPQPTRAAGEGLAVGQYLPVVALMVLAVLFGALSFFASRLLAPRRPSSAKEAPYECGIVPSREPPERFPVTFYVVAMLFIMFDIEIIFIYPYAVDRAVPRQLRVLGDARVQRRVLRRRSSTSSRAARSTGARCSASERLDVARLRDAHDHQHHSPRRRRRSHRGGCLMGLVQRRQGPRPRWARAQLHHRQVRRSGQVVAQPQQLAGVVRAWRAARSR